MGTFRTRVGMTLCADSAPPRGQPPRPTVVLLDNTRSGRSKVVNSAVLERAVTDRELTFRCLGHTAIIRRPNDLIFGLTANNAQLGIDLARRLVPIRLFYDGGPSQREFSKMDVAAWVQEHRTEVLAELVGLVTRWKAAGCPRPPMRRRFAAWTATVEGKGQNLRKAAETIAGMLDGKPCCSGIAQRAAGAEGLSQVALNQGLREKNGGDPNGI